jgi:hypothetical protein
MVNILIITIIGLCGIILYLVLGMAIIEFINTKKPFLLSEQNAIHSFEKNVCIVFFPIILIWFLSIKTHQFLKKLAVYMLTNVSNKIN